LHRTALITLSNTKNKSIKPNFLQDLLGGADLHFHGPQPASSLHCEVTTDTGLVHRTMCLSQLSLALIAPTHRGMARLRWPGWLVTYQDDQPSNY